VGAPSDPVESGCDQHRAELPATGQRRSGVEKAIVRRFLDLEVALEVVSLQYEKEDRNLPILDRWAELIRCR
jgi:hypothetical protein